MTQGDRRVSHQGLYTSIVIGNALHVGGVLPVGDAFLIEGTAAQDEPCQRSDETKTWFSPVKPRRC